MTSSSHRERLLAHLKANALRTDGPFTLRSGQTSNWYLDGRQTTFEGEAAMWVGGAIGEVLLPGVTAVGGMTMGADPVAIATAIESARAGRPLRAFSIRKAAKDHGTGGRLVGPIRPGDVIAALEDATTTGSALDEAIDVLVAEGHQVAQAISLVDRSGGAAATRMAARGIPFTAVFTPEDLGVSE